MAPRKYLSKEQLTDIVEGRSIPMPIFFTKSPESPNKIETALYVVDVGTIGPLNVPEDIVLEKMNPDGLITVCTYQLVDTYKASEKHFNELQN